MFLPINVDVYEVSNLALAIEITKTNWSDLYQSNCWKNAQSS